MNRQIKIKSAVLHRIAFVLGLPIFLLSVMLAVFFSYNRFYSLFAVGSLLILSWIDYKINKDSILEYFFFKSNKRATLIFFAVSTVSFFTVDYIYGVKVAGMWNWIDYEFIDYTIMFLFMNLAFILSTYELYKLVSLMLRKTIPDKNLLKINFVQNQQSLLYKIIFISGLIFLALPLYVFIFNINVFIEYAMIFPFFGVLLLTDFLTYRLEGDLICEKILNLNPLYISSFIFTSILASFATEFVNLFGHEWEYLRMPFDNITIFTIPAAVFLGWIPLVLAVVSIVNMTKSVNRFLEKKGFR